MITGEHKSNVDRIWETMREGGIANLLCIIEQITYLFYIKRLDFTLARHRTEEPITCTG